MQSSGAVAEWLTREIRTSVLANYLFLYEGAGSNPAGVEIFLSCVRNCLDKYL